MNTLTRFLKIGAIVTIFPLITYGQCPTTPLGFEAYGSSQWIGYVFDGADNYASNYLGTINEATPNFDRSWANTGTFMTNTPCAVDLETYSVRFKMTHAFGCGTFTFTLGGDDGVRLSIDGVTVSNSLYNNHPYQTTTVNYFLSAGNHDFIVEFYENAGLSRVSFNAALVVPATGGVIGADQSLCQSPVIDPAACTNDAPAFYCSGASPQYQWQESLNGTSGWVDINLETNVIYDIPSGFPANSTKFYRRRATDGVTPVYSNVITVFGDTPVGDQSTEGANQWLAYVYDGANNFASANYLGAYTEPTTFTQGFCGNGCTFPLDGCDVFTETFTVRYKMQFTVPTGGTAGYTFTVGGDDGYRFSVNGGTTWLINNYSDHGDQNTSSSVVNLTAGNTYNFVLEFYENGGGNIVRFGYTTGPLPVSWLYFDGQYVDGKNLLEWHTASEKDNQGFEIERSVDGSTFEKIGWTDGHGTTRSTQTYIFTDAEPSLGWNYYRLKQIDYDGTFEYSRLIPVLSNANLPRLYPNPVGDHDHLYFSGIRTKETVTIILTNMVTGRHTTLAQDRLQPSRFLIHDMQPGIYSASIRANDTVYTEKVLIK